jgi:hypothetical protein
VRMRESRSELKSERDSYSEQSLISLHARIAWTAVQCGDDDDIYGRREVRYRYTGML